MKEEIVKIIAGILEVDVYDIEMDTAVGDLPEWDSMHHLQIIAELEKVYNIKFNASDLAELERLKRKQILTERKIKFSTEAKKAIDEYRNQPIEILEGVLMVSQNCNLACRYCYGCLLYTSPSPRDA